MSTYEVSDAEGNTIEMEGNSIPTENDIKRAFRVINKRPELFKKEEPSVASMIAPQTAKYALGVGTDNPFSFSAPKKQPNQTAESHAQAVNDWQKNNRINLEGAAPAVIRDVFSFLPRATGLATAEIADKGAKSFGLEKGAPGIKKWISGDENATPEEIMANPETSIMRPITAAGQKNIEQGNTKTGVAQLALGSFDSPSMLAKSIGTAGKLSTKIPLVGNVLKSAGKEGASVVESISKYIVGNRPALRIHTFPEEAGDIIRKFAGNTSSPYSKIEALSKKLANRYNLDEDHVAETIKALKQATLQTYNKNVKTFGKKIASGINYTEKLGDALGEIAPKIDKGMKTILRSSDATSLKPDEHPIEKKIENTKYIPNVYPRIDISSLMSH